MPVNISGGTARAAYRIYMGLIEEGVECKVLVQEKYSDHDFIINSRPQNSDPGFCSVYT